MHDLHLYSQNWQASRAKRWSQQNPPLCQNPVEAKKWGIKIQRCGFSARERNKESVCKIAFQSEISKTLGYGLIEQSFTHVVCAGFSFRLISVSTGSANVLKFGIIIKCLTVLLTFLNMQLSYLAYFYILTNCIQLPLFWYQLGSSSTFGSHDMSS